MLLECIFYLYLKTGCVWGSGICFKDNNAVILKRPNLGRGCRSLGFRLPSCLVGSGRVAPGGQVSVLSAEASPGGARGRRCQGRASHREVTMSDKVGGGLLEAEPTGLKEAVRGSLGSEGWAEGPPGSGSQLITGNPNRSTVCWVLSSCQPAGC